MYCMAPNQLVGPLRAQHHTETKAPGETNLAVSCPQVMPLDDDAEFSDVSISGELMDGQIG